jgi:hypothetical protein
MKCLMCRSESDGKKIFQTESGLAVWVCAASGCGYIHVEAHDVGSFLCTAELLAKLPLAVQEEAADISTAADRGIKVGGAHSVKIHLPKK